jgi:hypothetical protein
VHEKERMASTSKEMVVELDFDGTLQRIKLQDSIFQIKDVLDVDKIDADVNNLLQYLLLSEDIW